MELQVFALHTYALSCCQVLVAHYNVKLTSLISLFAVILCEFSISNGIDGLHPHGVFSAWVELLQRDFGIVGILVFHNVGCPVSV